jgi:hypothetical protein
VYYGTAPGSYIQPFGAGLAAGNVTTFTATALQKGVTYYFSVTDTDGLGNESAYSNEASMVVQ